MVKIMEHPMTKWMIWKENPAVKNYESHVTNLLFPWEKDGGDPAEPISPWHRAAQHGQRS